MTDDQTSHPFLSHDTVGGVEPSSAVSEYGPAPTADYAQAGPVPPPAPPMFAADPSPAVQSQPVNRRSGKLAVIGAASLATIAAATFGALYFGTKADLADSEAETSRLNALVASQQDALDLADTKAEEMQVTIDDQADSIEEISADLSDAKEDLADASERGDLCSDSTDEWQEQALRLAKVLDAVGAQDVDAARKLLEEVADNAQSAVDAAAACHVAAG